jgi:hypothetical protein
MNDTECLDFITQHASSVRFFYPADPRYPQGRSFIVPACRDGIEAAAKEMAAAAQEIATLKEAST